MAIATTIVKAYCGTGFDINNIPASPSLLETTASKIVTLETLNCLPLSGKDSGSITVRAFQDLDEVDYLRLQFDLDSTVYYCTNIRYEYISLDTVVISFVIDAWLTSGGVANMSSVSGITSRRHVAKTDDVLFAFTEEDEMIAPSKPLEIHGGHAHFNNVSTFQSTSIVQSTVDLFELGKQLEAEYSTGGTLATFISAGSGEGVTVPRIPELKVSGSTAVIPIPGSGIQPPVVQLPYTVSYPIDSTVEIPVGDVGIGATIEVGETVRKGIAYLRCLGAESAITDAYEVPTMFFGSTDIDVNDGPTGAIGSVQLKGIYDDSEYAVDAVYREAHNKKVYSGKCNSYFIHSIATGNSASFNPEDIMESTDSAPQIFMFSDPRSNGKPYFRFKKYLKQTSTWFTNLVEGMEWQKSPIAFKDKSGVYANDLSFQNSREYQDRGLDISLGRSTLQGKYNANNAFAARMGSAVLDAVSSAIPMASGSKAKAAGASIVSGGISLGANIYTGILDFANSKGNINFANGTTEAEYESNRTRERQKFRIDNYIVAPQVSFAYNQSLRDAIGNGCYSYKYRLSDSDLIKCDQLLTMYGYRTTGPLLKEHFTNRPKFNYIEAGAVKIEYNVQPNKRIRELAQAQIEAGIRIWHIKPVDLSTVVNE